MKFANRGIICVAAAAITISFSAFAYAANAEKYVNITRGETAEMICSLAQKIGTEFPESEEKFYDDTNDAAPQILAAAGVVNGVAERTFAPNEYLTREQMCTILTRLIDKTYDDVDVSVHPRYFFDDGSYVSYWAKAPVNYLYFLGVINGTGDNTVSPLDTLTREQAETMCDRIYEKSQNGGFALKEETPDFSWEIKPQFDGLVPNTKFACGLAAVSKNGKYGYINKNGEVVIPYSYDRGYDFLDGMAKVEKNGKIGYIDKRGKICIPIEYEDGGDFYEDRVWVKKDGKIGFLNKQGQCAIPFEYDYAYDFEEGLAAVKKNGKFGFIDKSGNTVIPFKFEWASSFSEGLARMCENGRYSYIDKNGEIAIDCKYQYIYDFSEGVAHFYDRECWGTMDKNGKILNYGNIGWRYSSSEGYIKIHPNDDYERRYGFVDSYFTHWIFYMDRKDQVVPSDFNDFHEGLAAAAYYKQSHDSILRSYMSKNGKFIFPKRETIDEHCEYDLDTFYLMDFSEGMAAVVNNEGKLGFVKNPLF